MQKLRLLSIFFVALLPIGVWAQLTTYPLERNSIQTSKPGSKSAKVNVLNPVSLPFWDDFSFTPLESQNYPLDSLWIKNRQILVSSGQAINPPSINVATFDGLDEAGTPYSPDPNETLAFGYRDSLESQPIKMTEVFPTDRGSVYLSFSYQAGGNGEPPDPIDFLRLEFKKSDGDWQSITTLTVEEASDPTVFYNTLIPITDDIFYHDDFRFRFVSFGRKSGRFDAWHIDYVYLNQGRSGTDNSFPDRSYYTKLSPLFNDYYAVPQSHFITDVTGNISFPVFGLSNLESNPQPMNYNINSKIISYEAGLPNEQEGPLAIATPILPSIQGYEKRLITLSAKPDLASLTSADSIFIQLTMILETGDSINTGYEPIDFYVNDTLRQTYQLTNYYAYDDGIAEYSAGLVDQSNELAYRFTMKTSSQDTLNGVFINFPSFTGISANSVEFFILDNINGKPGATLYEETIDVSLNSGNQFLEHPFYEGVVVQDTFYIGYREPSTGSIRIGLDKSNDTGEQLYYRLTENSTWQLNDRVTGSLMMRPRFGPASVTTSLQESQHPVSIYPNPSAGEFYVNGTFEQLRVISVTGQPMDSTIEDFGDNKRVRVGTATTGIYFVQYKSGTKFYTVKILISK